MNEEWKSIVYSSLDQLRWELVIQESEGKGEKISPEVIETAKSCIEKSGERMLPKIKIQKPKQMDSQRYSEALTLFKDCMTMKRQAEIKAIDILMNLLENEILPFPEKCNKVMNVDPNEILDGSNSEDGEQWKLT